MKRRRRIFAVGTAGLVCLIAAAAMGLVSIQRAAIQKQLDSFPRRDGVASGLGPLGGVLQLPAGDIDLGNEPLLVGSGITLRGHSMLGTRIVYHGTGPAVRFKSYDGHGYHSNGEVHDLTIYSERGDGIGIDETTANNEGAGMVIKNVLLNVAGTAMKLRKERGDRIYSVRIEHVLVTGAGAGVLDFKGTMLHVDGLFLINPRRPIVQGFKGAAINLDGFGAIENSQLEGDWGGPLLQATGNWKFYNNWYEARRQNEPQVVFDKCAALMDLPMFVMPAQPYLLKNGSTLRVTGDLHFSANGGGFENAPIEQCYVTQDNSKVIHEGKVRVQKQ